MSSRHQYVSERPYNRAPRVITVQQQMNRRLRHDAMVGRKLELPRARCINKILKPQLHDEATYRRLGHIAAVYIYPDELRARRKEGYSIKLNRTIESLDGPLDDALHMSRGELHIVQIAQRDDVPRQQFWVRALTERARQANGQIIDTRQEELTVANELFNEDNDQTGATMLWLGALSAPSRDAAHEALDVLEDIIPTMIPASPVRLLTHYRAPK